MKAGLAKPWRKLHDLEGVWGQLGVYELGDDAGRVLFIGFAGGLSRYGLRGELQSQVGHFQGATCYRLEITSAYHTRYRELLMRHIAAHDAWPEFNQPFPIGKLTA